jgi:general secretion pathway protein A
MYEQHYGLRERPFDLSPDPRFLFLSRRHREALAHLRYGLRGRPGITALMGEAGTGKTTLVRSALRSAEASASHIVHMSNPTLTRAEFFEYLTAGFGFDAEVGTSKTRFLQALEAALNAKPAQILALIVDEAQSLTHELLEEVRLLTNISSPGHPPLTVVLVGQPELAARLREPSLRQLKQRVTLRCELRPFDLKETAAYIQSRVRIAGGTADQLFTRDAIVAIHEYSTGIPRTISVICENALVNGFAADMKPVGRDVVLEVCRDFELEPAAAQSPVVETDRSDAAEHVDVVGSRVEARVEARVRPAVLRNEAVPDGRPLFSGFSRPRRFSFF